MGKTSKGAQAANQSALSDIQPNEVPGGGPLPGGESEGSPPAAPRFNGTGEGIPQHTFIMSPRAADDDFILGAEIYHTNCGLQPVRVNSLGHMVELLAAASTPLSRIRLVTHANGDDLIMPLFGETTVRADRHVYREHLTALAESDEKGIVKILDMSRSGHYENWRHMIGQITSFIRDNISNNQALLTPLGLGQAGNPTGDLREFFFYCCDLAMVNRNLVTVNGNNLNAERRAQIVQALEFLIGKKAGAAAPVATALKNYITGLSTVNLGDPLVNNYTVPANSFNFFALAKHAVDAMVGGFRADLTTVRGRLSENSILDIRGCRAGNSRYYLQAVQALFGREGHLPTVTGPEWFQYFGPVATPIGHDFPDNNAIRNYIVGNGENERENREEFEDWASRSQINDRHKAIWLERLETVGTPGNVIRFCQLNWRNDVLPLSLEISGWEAFKAMNFSSAIARMGVFFNVAGGSVPSGANLTTVSAFVSSELGTLASTLFTPITEANKAANFTALSTMDTQLGTSVVPGAAPDPLQVSDIEGYQNELKAHLESNQLSVIRDFMVSCRERINDEDNPGIYYYMLNIGMPVFLFRTHENMQAGHSLAVNNNQILVHRDFRNEAFRQWPHMLWAGTLPPGNNIATSNITQSDALRLAMVVETADVGLTRVFACPHPQYMSKMVAVTNTADTDPLAF